MPISADDRKKLDKSYEELIEFYMTQVKPAVVACERKDKDQRASIAAINEIRSAFEHVARAHSVVFEQRENDSGKDDYEYCKKNLDKAHAHLYRAGYDAFDIIAVSMARSIEKYYADIHLRSFDVAGVSLNEWNSRYRDAIEIINSVKTNKDLECKENEGMQFRKMLQAIELLKTVEEDTLKIDKVIQSIERIEEILRKYDRAAIYKVRPNAKEEVFEKYEKAKSGRYDDTEAFFRKMEDVRRALESDVPELDNLKKERRSGTVRNHAISFLVGYISGIITNFTWDYWKNKI